MCWISLFSVSGPFAKASFDQECTMHPQLGQSTQTGNLSFPLSDHFALAPHPAEQRGVPHEFHAQNITTQTFSQHAAVL